MVAMRGLLVNIRRRSEDNKYCTPDESKQIITLTTAKRSECMPKLYENLGRERSGLNGKIA